MFNHRTPNNAKWTYDEKKQGLIIQAISDIKAGEEIYLSYGLKTNKMFMTGYGFTLENNPKDQVGISIVINADDQLFAQKKKLYELNAVDKGEYLYKIIQIFLIRKTFDIQVVSQLMSHLRFVVIDSQDMLCYIKHLYEKECNRNGIQPFNSKKIPPLDIENEKSMLFILRQICENKLSEYDLTKIKYLEKIKSTSYKYQCILNILQGEINILKFYIYFVDQMLPLFELEINDIQDRAQIQDLLFYNYIQDVIVFFKQESGYSRQNKI